jgi:formylglycine-generating enzyme required for sulfatase activity
LYPRAVYMASLDMTGNVWEWTRSLCGKEEDKARCFDSYQLEDGREQLDATDDVERVLRGGGCYNSERGACCAI